MIPTDLINCMSSSSDNKIIATGHASNIKIWKYDDKTNHLVHTFSTGNDIRQISFSPDSTKIITLSPGKGFAIWDITTGKLLHSMNVPGIKCVAFFF